jgi:hypothetical protein
VAHYAYNRITGTGWSLHCFREGVVRLGKKWLARRRRRGFLSWTPFGRLLKRYVLPLSVIVQSVYRHRSEPVA